MCTVPQCHYLHNLISCIRTSFIPYTRGGNKDMLLICDYLKWSFCCSCSWKERLKLNLQNKINWLWRKYNFVALSTSKFSLGFTNYRYNWYSRSHILDRVTSLLSISILHPSLVFVFDQNLATCVQTLPWSLGRRLFLKNPPIFIAGSIWGVCWW